MTLLIAQSVLHGTLERSSVIHRSVMRSLLTSRKNLKLKMMYTAPFPVIAALLSCLFLIISIAAVSYFLSVSAARENKIAYEESLHIVKTAFSLTEKELSNWAKDYAWWDETLQKASDVKWAEDNIGTYLQQTFDVSGSFATSPDLQTIFYSPRTANVKNDALSFLGEKGASFLKKVQATSMTTTTPLVTYVRSADGLYLVTAAAITKEHPVGSDLVQHPRPLLILYKKMSTEFIKMLSDQFLLSKLGITDDANVGDKACIPLLDNSGSTIAYISWVPGKPGDQLFSELLPKISFVAVVLTLIALIVFFAWWRTASQANEAKSRFLAKMSHELRTPLNPIIGFANLMTNETMGPIPSQYKSYAADIHQSGLHLSTLIEDILDVSRIEAGQLALHETVFDVVEMIDSLPAFSNRVPDKNDAMSQPPEIRREIAENLPKLRADKLRVQQVLMNLISNAIKFSNGKSVTIRVNLNNDGILICVEDKGAGISKADLNLLFQPFVQVGRRNIEHRSHGTGLGLHISRELMRHHGGDLVLESRVDVGTTACVQFPSGRTV